MSQKRLMRSVHDQNTVYMHMKMSHGKVTTCTNNRCRYNLRKKETILNLEDNVEMLLMACTSALVFKK